MFVFSLFVFYIYGCFACIWVCAPYACSTHQGQKRASDTLGPDLIDVNLPLSGNQAWALWKSSGCC